MRLSAEEPLPSSADWQSAVSRIGNPPRVRDPTFCRLPVGGYGRLPTCATEKRFALHSAPSLPDLDTANHPNVAKPEARGVKQA